MIEEWGAKSKYVGREDGLQIKCIGHARRYLKHPLVWHTANERQTSQRRGAKLKQMGVTPGIPDILAADARGGFFGLAVELKAKGNKLTDHQKFMLEWFEFGGWYPCVVWSEAGMIDMLNWYTKMERTPGNYQDGEPPSLF